MPLDPDILSSINMHVRGGFEDREDILEILEDDFDLDDAGEDEIESAIDAAFDAHEAGKASWPAVTDCDKLDEAFAALSRSGLIALQNAGTTLSDGLDDVSEIYQVHPDKNSVTGYVFYHGQDLERALSGEGLPLAFGPIDAGNEAADGPRIGQLIADELRRAGLPVEWNGAFDQRIVIPAIDWKRR